MKALWHIFKRTFSEWRKDNAPRLGAALAYYALFSVGPLFLLAVIIAGWVFGEDAASSELFAQLRGLIGATGADAVAAVIESTRKRHLAGLAGTVSVITLIIGATGVIIELKESLNAIWSVKPKDGSGLRVFLKKYIVSLAAVMSLGFLLIISLIASAAIAAMGRYMSMWLPASESLLQAADFFTVWVLLTLLIGAIFKYLPDVRLRWRQVLPGALLTAALFSIGKFLISLYLGKVGFGSTFGAAGSIVVLMVWIYYTAQIFFFGAEFTEVYARERHGLSPEPEVDAEILHGAKARRSGVPFRGPLTSS